MDKKSKKVKEMIKRPGPDRKFGTDPRDPWSAKYNVSESAALDKYLLARGFNPKTTPKDIKIAHSKSNAFLNWQRSHMNETAEKTPIEHLPADKNKTPSDAMMSYAKKNKAKHIPSREVKNPPGTLRKEDSQIEGWSVDSEIISDAKKPKLSAYEKIQKAVQKEREKSAPDREAFMKKLNAIMPSPKKEDVGDPKAAVNADGLPNPQIEPASGMRKMSKGARLILDIKKKKMNEDMYDHEKADKSVATYGKKPKIDVANKEEGQDGKEKPKAAAVMSGGTTLTGQKRDVVEIDPAMRVRPGQPDPTKGKDKDKEKHKKDGKKKE